MGFRAAASTQSSSRAFCDTSYPNDARTDLSYRMVRISDGLINAMHQSSRNHLQPSDGALAGSNAISATKGR